MNLILKSILDHPNPSSQPAPTCEGCQYCNQSPGIMQTKHFCNHPDLQTEGLPWQFIGWRPDKPAWCPDEQD